MLRKIKKLRSELKIMFCNLFFLPSFFLLFTFCCKLRHKKQKTLSNLQLPSASKYCFHARLPWLLLSQLKVYCAFRIEIYDYFNLKTFSRPRIEKNRFNKNATAPTGNENSALSERKKKRELH